MMLKYICIGGSYKCAKTNKRELIHPKCLAELYKLDPKECALFLDENRFKNKKHRNKGFIPDPLPEAVYILRTRKHHDYVHYLSQLKLRRLLKGLPV